MTRPIGYYVHHHGDGHRQRALAIAEALGDGITLLGTGLSGRTGAVACVDLPDDRLPSGGFDGSDGVERPPCLHYAPVDHEGVRARTASIAWWIAEARPRLMVVDVSVEVALLCRIASVPTVYVRLNGRRDDRPHRDAFAGATALLVPFHAALDDPRTPDDIRAKSFYAPMIASVGPAAATERDLVLVVIGGGGDPSDGEQWADAARSTPHLNWRVIGPCTVPNRMPPNLELCGWVDDAERMIASAGVVVGAAGDGLVSIVIAHRRPFICIPEPRPYDEQLLKARRLAELGAAVVPQGVPLHSDWQGLIDAAIQLRSVWPDALDGAGGAGRVAEWLAALPIGGGAS